MAQIVCSGTIREIKADLKILLRSHKFEFYSISAPISNEKVDGYYRVKVNGNPLIKSMEAQVYEENKRMCEQFFETRTAQKKREKSKTDRN